MHINAINVLAFLVLVVKPFSCSTQLSMINCLSKLKIYTEKIFAFKITNVVFIMLINVKMPTIIGILTFMSMINFMLI